MYSYVINVIDRMRPLLVFLFALVAADAQADVSGKARVVDGDTIRIAGERIRLHGIDAPESGEGCFDNSKRWRCGQQAARALADRIGGRSVTCRERDRDRYRRIVAVCTVSGINLNQWMVAEGWAMAYRRFSHDYVADERSAQRSGKGIWRSAFVPPWDWRRGTRIRSETKTGTQPTNCRIKGNISRRGVRIYHVPGGQYYKRTKIDPGKGERWFCTEAEARAAGWRRSRR